MMKEYKVTAERISAFGTYLLAQERVAGTREKYLRDLRAFAAFLDGQSVTKERAADWKEHLLNAGYQPATINSMLAVLDSFRFAGLEQCRVKYLRVQRRLFREQSKELSRQDYGRLIETAHALKQRLALLIGTGWRRSETGGAVHHAEAAKTGRAEISLKGKIRTILLPSKLCRKLLKYAKKQKIASGKLFLTRSGNGLSRRQIWSEMKRLCQKAGVEASKCFPII